MRRCAGAVAREMNDLVLQDARTTSFPFSDKRFWNNSIPTRVARLSSAITYLFATRVPVRARASHPLARKSRSRDGTTKDDVNCRISMKTIKPVPSRTRFARTLSDVGSIKACARGASRHATLPRVIPAICNSLWPRLGYRQDPNFPRGSRVRIVALANRSPVSRVCFFCPFRHRSSTRLPWNCGDATQRRKQATKRSSALSLADELFIFPSKRAIPRLGRSSENVAAVVLTRALGSWFLRVECRVTGEPSRVTVVHLADTRFTCEVDGY